MSEFSYAESSLAFGKANKVPWDKVDSLVVISLCLEEVPLNPLHSFRMLSRDPKKTEGIGGKVLENRFNQRAITSLTKGSPFPTGKFPVEFIYDVVPKGIQGFCAKRQPEIISWLGPNATSQDTGNFPLPLQRGVDEVNQSLIQIDCLS